MIRLKQTMGNAIKGKIEAEQVISKYECNLLSRKSLVGLLELQAEGKNGVIIYSGDVKRNLASQIQMGLEAEELYEYICQTVQTILDVKKLGLNPQHLVLNPEWIFVTKGEQKLKFIYCPVNGLAYQYDGILFLRDLVFQASLNANVRESLDKWLDSVSRSGITDKSLLEIKKYMGSKGGTNNIARRRPEPVLDDDGEALTGLEDVPMWAAIENDDGEVPTGTDSLPEWMQSNDLSRNFEEDDDDGEAKTDVERKPSLAVSGNEEEEPGCMPLFPKRMEDTNIFSEGGLGDGTYIESTSEPFSRVSKSNVKVPTLFRKRTGETVKVEKDIFKLGRSMQRADYCINNNSGISNIHAMIIKENNQYYVKDNHSTNGTYVDGEKILDSTLLVSLHEGSIIQLYDEEIEFHL